MPRYYDRQGKPMTLDEWSQRFEDSEGRRIGYDLIDDRYLVSTVWLGLDHNWDPNGPPLIFETMVFDETSEQPSLDLACYRYTTETEAREGHAEVVQLVRERQNAGDQAKETS